MDNYSRESVISINDNRELLGKEEFLERWGFDLENLYKIALKFYKGKDFIIIVFKHGTIFVLIWFQRKKGRPYI